MMKWDQKTMENILETIVCHWKNGSFLHEHKTWMTSLRDGNQLGEKTVDPHLAGFMAMSHAGGEKS